MDKEKLRVELNKYTQKQDKVATEMRVHPVYLNQFLNGFEGVSDKFITKGWKFVVNQEAK